MFDKTQEKVTEIDNSLKVLSILYQNDIKELKQELKSLEEKEKSFLHVKNLIDISHINDPIILQVGGVNFETSKSTLTKIPGSYFDVMFSGKTNIQPLTGTNTYFIDRDPTHFRYILNIMRDGLGIPIPDSIKTELLWELKYYRILNFDSINIDQIRKIEEWIGKNINKYELIYKGTRDGFESKIFREKCNSIGPTINIIKTTDGSIFGGYNSQAWNSHRDYYGDNKSFIFSLKNANGLPPIKYIPLFNSNIYFMLGGKDLFIVFGSGFDISISNQCNKNNLSYQKFPITYADSTVFGKSTFTTNQYFTVSEIEVFKLE